jgi:glycosyltransferase involved in cell wall biosynthesis
VEAVIAGGPDATRLDTDPMVRNFRALAARLGVDDRVTLLGSVDRNQVPNLIRSSDVVACVPWYEPFGMVALEAMACGVPVVASAVGGLVDTVVDGVTGIHVPPRRPDEVARALNLLLSEARLRKRMGAAGAERARNRYSWDLIAELTAEAYMLVTEREARTAEAWRRR